jgi:hypothetical protein
MHVNMHDSVISLLLLLCNDIHPIPGPLSNNSRCELRNISIVNKNVNSLRNKTELISTDLGDHETHILYYVILSV